MRAAIAELHALAVQSGDQQLAELLRTDDTVLAVMGAAVEVVEAEGMHVDRGDGPAAHRRRAAYWRRYGSGPVNALHRSCSADICRGSLRLLGTVAVTSESTHGLGSRPIRSPRPTRWWRRSSPA